MREMGFAIAKAQSPSAPYNNPYPLYYTYNYHLSHDTTDRVSKPNGTGIIAVSSHTSERL